MEVQCLNLIYSIRTSETLNPHAPPTVNVNVADLDAILWPVSYASIMNP